jgi:hypothetical protein
MYTRHEYLQPTKTKSRPLQNSKEHLDLQSPRYLTPLSPVSQIDGIGGRGLPTAPPPPFAWSCSATRERKRLEHTLQLGLRHRVY